MSKLMRMTVLPCLLLAGFVSLPANGQTKTMPPYFAHVLVNQSTCQGFTITVLDSSTPPREVFYEAGRTHMNRDSLLSKVYAVPGFDQKRDKIKEGELPCEFAGTVYTEPNQGNPAGNPDDEMKKKKVIQLAAAEWKSHISNPAVQKAQQVKPMNLPTAPRGTQERTVAPPQNPGTRQTAPTVPRP